MNEDADEVVARVPTRQDVAWMDSLARYVRWRNEHSGHPQASRKADREERNLRHWLLRQRREANAGKVEPWRVAALDAAVPDWRVSRQPPAWEESLFNLAAWMERHGGRLPRSGSGDGEERRLGMWLINNRQMMRGNTPYDTLTPERIKLLNATAPGWLSPPWGGRSHLAWNRPPRSS